HTTAPTALTDPTPYQRKHLIWSIAAAAHHPDHRPDAGAQSDIGHRQCRCPRSFEFMATGRTSHRAARVEKNVREQVLLLFKQLDVKLIGAAVETPIDIAEVIAHRIVPKVAEFQRGAAPWRQMGAFAQTCILAPGF